MILALYAALLLAQPAGAPPPDANGPAAEAGQNGDGRDHDVTAEDRLEAAAEAVEEAAEAAAEASEEPVEDEDMVCRRRHEYNQFGRRTSRKVCRPRSE